MPREHSPLKDVVTATEAMRIWDIKSRNTVLNAIDHGKLEFRPHDGGFLISYWSLVELWGEPKNSPSFLVHQVLPQYRKKHDDRD